MRPYTSLKPQVHELSQYSPASTLTVSQGKNPRAEASDVREGRPREPLRE
jgi:hypothetical protein